MKTVSKFEYQSFISDGIEFFAVNRQKYSKREAISIFEKETDFKIGDELYDYSIRNSFARHIAGITEYGEPTVCWWLEQDEYSNSCPVWEFYQNI